MDILDLIFPRKCLECGKMGKYICTSCLAKIDKASYINRSSYAIWIYGGVVRKAIISLKYKFAYKIAEELAEAICDELKKRRVFEKDFILVPIPLHARRKNWRGFNQSEEVGRILAKKMGWGFTSDFLVRKRLTKPQVGLRGGERRTNIKGVFALRPKYLMCNARYLIFDDVWTTGSTINEAMKILKKAGAENIMSLTIAK
jgi:ComF family protein